MKEHYELNKSELTGSNMCVRVLGPKVNTARRGGQHLWIIQQLYNKCYRPQKSNKLIAQASAGHVCEQQDIGVSFDRIRRERMFATHSECSLLTSCACACVCVWEYSSYRCGTIHRKGKGREGEGLVARLSSLVVCTHLGGGGYASLIHLAPIVHTATD